MTVPMSFMVVAGVVATGIAFIFVPRQRRALPFEIVLALGTLVVAVLAAALALDAASALPILAPLRGWMIAGVQVLPVVIGAFGGAFVVVVPLWFMDRATEAVESE